MTIYIMTIHNPSQSATINMTRTLLSLTDGIIVVIIIVSVLIERHTITFSFLTRVIVCKARTHNTNSRVLISFPSLSL